MSACSSPLKCDAGLDFRPAPALAPVFLSFALLPFMGGYFLSYLVRNANATVASRLIAEFGFGPIELGLLTSLYFLTSALTQVPAGLLIDRYGPRRVQVVMLMIGAVGAAGFGLAHSTAALMVSRALIGFGTSTALMTGFKAVMLWVPTAQRVTARSWLVGCGGLGALAATLPMEWAAATLGWRGPFLVLAALFVLLAFVMLRSPERGRPPVVAWGEICGGLAVVLRDQRFWRVAPLSATLVGGVFAIQGLWASRWLCEVWGLSSHDASAVLLWSACGLVAGAPMFGMLGRAAQRRGVPMQRVFGAAGLVLMAVEATMALGVPAPPALLLTAFASFGALTVLGFSLIDGMFPPELGGRANAAYNVVQLGTTCVVQAGFGLVVATWPAGVGSHAAAPGYAAATAFLMALQAIAFLWFVRPEATARALFVSGRMEIVT